MRFKVQRTLLADPTLRPFANGVEGLNPLWAGDDRRGDVEITSLDERMAFSQLHGELVIGTESTEHYAEI